ncbi:MAG: tRNA (guanine(46)-N(7))-methyltransferase TrmB [Hyphomicrobiaceae bacterium]|nr:tRNA (guanine(46)-N(7))-methyltransferase TrmB [Hyphomicrobiaceae bacterium]
MARDDESHEQRPATGAGRDLRSFGRRRGRAFSPRQARLLSDVLPVLSMPAAGPVAAPLTDLFPMVVDDVWLEIGFGGAEHLLWQAERNPHVGIIGCEPFEDGVVKALAGVEDRGLSNIRLHPDDARPLLRRLPDASVARAFVLFPDPWPKKRHVKRRLVSPSLLGDLARVMSPGAELRIATDIGDYLRTVLIAVAAEPRFSWSARGPADWRVRPSDWPQTRYEEKAGREGRRCYFLSFRRCAAQA